MMPPNSPTSARTPWAFIPTLYFAQGLAFVIVNTMSTVIYKDLGVSNALIGITSLLYLPWVIKPLWSPIIEMFGTKRGWIVAMQIVLALGLAGASFTLNSPFFFVASLVVFIAVAFVSATHDISVDGFYLLALPARQQAFFVGIRSTFYRLATITGSGLLVMLAGHWIQTGTTIAASWAYVLLIAGGLYALHALWHYFILPHPAEDRTVQSPKEAGFFEVWASYFRQEKIGWVLAFILLFRLGEAMLMKMLVPFLKDIPSRGGLGLSTEQVGLVYGTLGILGLVVGGIVGGILIARFGLRRCIFPMALCVHLPNLGYLYLAHFQPTGWSVPLVVAVEQLGYGFGFTAFMVFLMQTVGDRFKTAHFAISTGFMALGMMLPGMVSGYIQEATGYFAFFVIVCLFTLPGLATIPFLPIRNMPPDDEKRHPA